MKRQKVKNFIINNKWFIIGGLLVILYVFSNYMYGLKLSFTNMNYSFEPFNSTGTFTTGPLLSDIADSHYPSVFRIFYSNEGLTLWDSDIGLGRGVDSVVFLMNPMEWVYFLPMAVAIFLKAFSEFALGFFFMFLFMRSIGIKKYGAALSGVIYAFSSVIVVWLGWPHSDVAVWAPLLFYAIEKLINTLKIQYMFLIALSVYMMLIVTMPTYAAYFMYLAGIYIIIFAFKKHWKNKRNAFIVGGLFALGVVLATVASLPYTYTLLNNVVSNGYMDSREAYGTAKLSWSYLRTLVYPYLRDGMTMHINESTIYVGLTSLAFLPFIFFNNKAKKRNLFFIFASIILFVLIFTDGLNFVYTKLPLVSTSLKFRVIALLTFSLSAITGITINDFVENKEYYKNKKWIFAICVTWSVLVVLLASKNIFSNFKKHIAFALVAVLAAVFLSAAIVLLKKYKKVAYIALAVLIVFDSAFFAKRYLPWISADASVIPEPTDSISYMIDNSTQQERIAGVGNWVFFPNTPSFYELNDVRTHGFEATNPDVHTYYIAIDSTSYASNTRQEFHNIENIELLKYLGVKYIYGSVEYATNSIEKAKTEKSVCGDVYIGDDGLIVAELNEYSSKVELVSKVQPYDDEAQVLDEMKKGFVKNTAFMVSDSKKAYDVPLSENEKIELVTYKDNYVKVVCTTECDRYVMLNDYYNENWTAYVNGKKVDIEKTNYLMRAVKVESGKDIVVEFKYEPNDYYVIIGIAFGVIFLTAVLFVFKNKLQMLIDKVVVNGECCNE